MAQRRKFSEEFKREAGDRHAERATERTPALCFHTASAGCESSSTPPDVS